MSNCSKCETDLKLYICPRHKIYVCYNCVSGVKHMDGVNADNQILSKFVFKCVDEDCNFVKL